MATLAMYYRELRRPTQRDQEIVDQITHLAGVTNGNARSGTDARIVKCLLVASAGVPGMSAKLVAPASSAVLASFRSILIPSLRCARGLLLHPQRNSEADLGAIRLARGQP